MHNRHYLYSLGLIFLVFSLAMSHRGGLVTATAAPNNDKGTTLKVAMLLPGPIDDGGWNQSGYEGLQLIERKLGAQVAFTASVTQEQVDVEQHFRQYVQKGYDFIIGHGGQYIAVLESMADEFPDTKFAVVADYAGNNKNLGALTFRNEEIGYLTGVVAALKTRTNKLSFISGVPYSHLLVISNSFKLGAKSITPSIEVAIEWVGNWTDADKTRMITRKYIKAGTDVIAILVDAATPAGFEEAQKAGVYAIGWTVDQYTMAPGTILSSGMQRIPVLLFEGTMLVQRQRWEGKKYNFGLREGAQDLAPFYGLLTPEEEARVDAVRYDILTNKIYCSR